MSFICLGRVNSSDFTLLGPTVKSLVSLISFSVHFSFEYRRATYNHVSSPFAESVHQLYCLPGRILKTMCLYNHIIDKKTLTSFFPICMLLNYFSFLIAPAVSSRTTLNRCGENGQPYLLPGFSRIVWFLSV